jgi:drug/metabolite transporter (DMT)-like permease
LTHSCDIASLFYLGQPVMMLMTWLKFGDTVRVMDLVGLGIVFAGVMLTQLEKKSINYKTAETEK